MTPKEKASNLVEIFWTEVEDNNYETRKMSFAQAKQSALIAVNEILASHYKVLTGIHPTTYDYFIEVKQEIELL